MIINPKDFSSRKELEKHIVSEIGQDIETNRKSVHQIKGKKEYLKRLQLSEKNNIFGVKVVPDGTTKKLPASSKEIRHAKRKTINNKKGKRGKRNNP